MLDQNEERNEDTDKTKQSKLVDIQEACKNNLKFLCKEVLHMKDWQDGLHDDLGRAVYGPDKQKLILMPRGHFKSSIITVGYSIQRLLRNPNLRILITNAVWDQAREFLRQINEYLMSSSDLRHFFGDFNAKNTVWTKNEITIAQKTDATKRGPSIRTAGLETSLTGTHCDLIIHDDLVELNNVQTKDQIKKVAQFHDASLDLLDPGGEMITIGTRWAEDDLYGLIIKERSKSVNGYTFKDDLERKRWRDFISL